MGSKFVASVALLLSINLLFSSMVSSSSHYYPPPPPSHVPTPVTPPPSPSLTPPSPSSTPPPPSSTPPPNCPDLRICLNLLNPSPPMNNNCCTLLADLADLQVNLCLCAQIDVVGINIDVILRLILNQCRRSNATNATCPGT